MKKISFLSLYVINKVRLLRLVHGLSSRTLSENSGLSSGYVGMVESIKNNGQYPPDVWPMLAESLNSTVHELLPPESIEQNSTGDLIDKKVLSLDNENDIDLVLKTMIQYSFFDTPKFLTDVIKHLFINEHGQVKLLENSLNKIVDLNVLSKRENQYFKELPI